MKNTRRVAISKLRLAEIEQEISNLKHFMAECARKPWDATESDAAQDSLDELLIEQAMLEMDTNKSLRDDTAEVRADIDHQVEILDNFLSKSGLTAISFDELDIGDCPDDWFASYPKPTEEVHAS